MKRTLLVLLTCALLTSSFVWAKEPVVRFKGIPSAASQSSTHRDQRSPLDEVFTSDDVPIDIIDGPGGEVMSDLIINATYDIADLNVFVTITHTYTSDLQIFLSKVGGPEVRLFNHRGGAGDNITGCTFDDEATTGIGSGAAPFTGSFRPEAVLSAFDGISITGTWQLRVLDDAAEDIGTIDEWGVDVQPANASNGQIQGVVTVAGSGEFVSLAHITVDGQVFAACTGEDGTYLLTQVPAGTYTVRIDNEFYRPSVNTNVVVPAGGNAFVDAALSVWPDLQTATAPSSGAAVDIVDLDTSFKSIVVGDAFTLSDIDVIVNITHTYIGDLDIWVENPAGERAQLLLNNVGNNGADITDCRFDDEACESVASATAPYTGRWYPAAGNCADAENGSSQGQWRLVVYDNFDVDEGTIDNWTLIASHFTILDAEEVRPDMPNSFRFDGNFPNPFNNSTAFRFSLARTMNVSLDLYNSAGQHVVTVFDHEINAGEHTAYFDASKLTSGLYFARMNAGGNVATHKMILLK